jgi:hypothetical protein
LALLSMGMADVSQCTIAPLRRGSDNPPHYTYFQNSSLASEGNSLDC